MWNGGQALMVDLAVLVMVFDTRCYEETQDC